MNFEQCFTFGYDIDLQAVNASHFGYDIVLQAVSASHIGHDIDFRTLNYDSELSLPRTLVILP